MEAASPLAGLYSETTWLAPAVARAAFRRAGLGCGAQHLAGRKLYQTMLGDEPLYLRAFAGPRPSNINLIYAAPAASIV
jgi:hypothetical protein